MAARALGTVREGRGEGYSAVRAVHGAHCVLVIVRGASFPVTLLPLPSAFLVPPRLPPIRPSLPPTSLPLSAHHGPPALLHRPHHAAAAAAVADQPVGAHGAAGTQPGHTSGRGVVQWRVGWQTGNVAYLPSHGWGMSSLPFPTKALHYMYLGGRQAGG